MHACLPPLLQVHLVGLESTALQKRLAHAAAYWVVGWKRRHPWGGTHGAGAEAASPMGFALRFFFNRQSGRPRGPRPRGGGGGGGEGWHARAKLRHQKEKKASQKKAQKTRQKAKTQQAKLSVGWLRDVAKRCERAKLCKRKGEGPKRYTALGLPSWSPTLVLTQLDPA